MKFVKNPFMPTRIFHNSLINDFKIGCLILSEQIGGIGHPILKKVEKVKIMVEKSGDLC